MEAAHGVFRIVNANMTNAIRRVSCESGYDARDVAFILGMMAVIMGGIQGGGMRPLVARFGERRLIVGGAVLMGLAFASIPWLHRVTLLLVPLAVSAAGRAISQPSLMGLASLAATAQTRGVVMGTFQSAASLARIFGPVAAGLLYDLSMGAPFLLLKRVYDVLLLPARHGAV